MSNVYETQKKHMVVTQNLRRRLHCVVWDRWPGVSCINCTVHVYKGLNIYLPHLQCDNNDQRRCKCLPTYHNLFNAFNMVTIWQNKCLHGWYARSAVIFRWTFLWRHPVCNTGRKPPQIAKFMGLTWGPPGTCRPQMGPILASWTLLWGCNVRTTSNNLF